MHKNHKDAIGILDGLIIAHIKNSKGLEDMVKDWTSDSKGLGMAIASVHEDVAKCLFVVKKLLEEKPKIRRKLEHPKSQ